MWDLNVKGGGSSGSGSIAASSGNQTGSTQQTLTAQHIEKTKEPNLFLAVSPDGTYLGVSNERDELSIYDMRTWRIFKQIKYKVNINGFSWDKADGRLFLVGD
jgi:6-phosphogluconolactonase (cycloisomerase 2 family)